MSVQRELAECKVNCRIGSLENFLLIGTDIENVNCRIGSLERSPSGLRKAVLVNCRIGSLERFDLV